MTILRARELKKTFSKPTPVEILKGIDLTIEAGESIAITGKSGEGKSTLLHILGTLEKPSSGDLEICGQNVATATLSELRNRQLGFIFQNHNLLEEYTVLENVLMPAKIARLPTHPGSFAYKRAEMLLERVHLTQRASFLAKLLSGEKSKELRSHAPSATTRLYSSPMSLREISITNNPKRSTSSYWI